MPNSRSCIVRNQEWDSALAQLYPLHFSKLVLCLRLFDAVYSEATLGIVDQPKVLARLLDADNIHEAGWVGDISADFAVNLDEALHDNGFCFTIVKGILETAERSISVSKLGEGGKVANRFRMKTIRGRQSRSL